jgi:hypothetical protein
MWRLAAFLVLGLGCVAMLGRAGVGEDSLVVGWSLMVPAMLLGTAYGLLGVESSVLFVVQDGFPILTKLGVASLYAIPAVALYLIGARLARRAKERRGPTTGCS